MMSLSLPAMADGVDFQADVTSGTVPLAVHFSDKTPGYEPDWHYSWSFGNGGSTAKNPANTYTNTGTYDVSLTITNGSGGTIGTITKTGYITVSDAKPSAPSVDFRMSPASGPAPLMVNFTCLSSAGTLSYDWDFGDGTQHSAEMSPVHVYSKVGSYTITLKVSNPGGSNTKSNTVTVTAPVVTAQGNTTSSNNSSMAAGVLGVTAVPSAVSTIAAAAPQNGGLLTFSMSEDMLQIVLTALIAIVIAFMVIYYFSSMSKREEKKQEKKAPAQRSMLKSRMPVIGQKATDGVVRPSDASKPADASTAPDMSSMPIESARQPEAVSAPEPVKVPVIINAPDMTKIAGSDIPLESILGLDKQAKDAPETVRLPPVEAKPPEPLRAPETAKPVAKPADAAWPQVPVKAAPITPEAKPIAAVPPQPAKQPMKLTDLLKSKAKEEPKTPPAAAPKPVKQSRRRNDVDKDYLYGLVMGDNPEPENKDKK